MVGYDEDREPVQGTPSHWSDGPFPSVKAFTLPGAARRTRGCDKGFVVYRLVRVTARELRGKR